MRRPLPLGRSEAHGKFCTPSSPLWILLQILYRVWMLRNGMGPATGFFLPPTAFHACKSSGFGQNGGEFSGNFSWLLFRRARTCISSAVQGAHYTISSDILATYSRLSHCLTSYGGAALGVAFTGRPSSGWRLAARDPRDSLAKHPPRWGLPTNRPPPSRSQL